MTVLRRSVLVLRAQAGMVRPWPPPGPEAVPDAAILQPEGAGSGTQAAVDLLGVWGIDAILDVPLDAAPAGIPTGAASLLCRAETTAGVQQAERLAVALEAARGLPAGRIGLELLAASPRAFLELDELASASDRIVSVIADPAALAQAFGVEPTVEVDQFAYPRGRLVLAAARRRIQAVGLFEPAGHHRAAASGMDAARFSFASGLHGGLCRTWADVTACNQGFSPDAARVARARRIIEAMAEAGRRGLGAISLDGRMIDLPFIRASEAALALTERIAARDAAVQRMFVDGR